MRVEVFPPFSLPFPISPIFLLFSHFSSSFVPYFIPFHFLFHFFTSSTFNYFFSHGQKCRNWSIINKSPHFFGCPKLRMHSFLFLSLPFSLLLIGLVSPIQLHLSSAASDHSESSSATLFLSLISWFCALGGLLLGYGTSIISDSLHFMTADLRLNTFSQGITTASLLVGGAFGALAGGKAADLVGRRRAMVTLCFLFIVGNLCSSLAPTFPLLLSARIFLGFSLGGFSSVVPIFLSELSPSSIRAQIVTRSTLNIVAGQLLAFVVGALLGSVWEERLDIWRWMNAVSLFPALLLLSALLLFVPESPRWLVSSGQMGNAFVVLCRIRHNAEEAREELAEIAQSQTEKSGKEKLTFSAFLWDRWLRNCVMIGLGIALIQQIVGVSAPMYYGTNILERCGMDIELAMIVNIAIGIVSLVSMAFGLWLMGRCGRRPMLLVGMVGSSLSHLLVALIFWLMPSGNAKGVVVLLLLLLFCAFMQCSITSVTWFILAEIFPLRVRGITMGLCSAIVWMTKFAYGLFLPLAMDFLGISATFLLLLLFTSLSTIFVWLFLPETRDKTLEEMEKQFREEDWAALKRKGRKRSKETRERIEDGESGERS